MATLKSSVFHALEVLHPQQRIMNISSSNKEEVVQPSYQQERQTMIATKEKVQLTRMLTTEDAKPKLDLD